MRAEPPRAGAVLRAAADLARDLRRRLAGEVRFGQFIRKFTVTVMRTGTGRPFNSVGV
jgi:hypothetical protein